MKIELRYFTGTGNSLKVLRSCETIFSDLGHACNLSRISVPETNLHQSDLIGFCFPVYAFDIPRICRNYLKSLRKCSKQQEVFILLTAGDKNEAGFAIKQCTKILKKRNYKIIYSEVIQMPINWTTSPKPPFPPSDEEAEKIISQAEAISHKIANDIINGVKHHHKFNYPKRYSKLKFYSDYLLFKYLGIQNMWRSFAIYNTCDGCGLCANICPTKSIKMLHKKPEWTKTCEQCMRCVNFCPKEAIYQSHGGDTIGKNKYRAPGFKPKSNN
ncbi:EFR1 family ferrodoxin [Marinifilum caeruleilacunae]|uniref:4Fe-4S ferredoxin-type domain-containing protein n=1 Tax=Marinifilum caeruleilacunae TaxID=2499076 RepID=A0ABX1WRB8_9BACT|nr:EFR1 family ferrodoxin [Marinifilum caeruleilacunae]NOU58478.1 hypothetical protein [Marinifilum caeruleilacunae]